INAAADVIDFRRSRTAKFLVLRMQKILADERQLKMFARSPADARVHLKIAWHTRGYAVVIDPEPIDPPHRAIEFNILGKIEGGADVKLVLGIGSLVETIAAIHRTRVDVDPFFEKIISRVQAPSVDHLIIYAQFDAIGLRAKIVCEMQRQTGK